MNCDHSSDHCHHPKAHGFDHFYGIPITNLRDCQPGHGSVFFVVKAIFPYGTVAAALATLLFLHAAGIMTVSRRLALGLVLLLTTALTLFGFFILTFANLNCFLMRGEEVVEQPYVSENLTQRMTSEAVEFLERSENAKSQLLERISIRFIKPDPFFKGCLTILSSIYTSVKEVGIIDSTVSDLNGWLKGLRSGI